MGHFSYSCRLSGLPISEGDKAVLIPLLPAPHWDIADAKKFGVTNYCSNDGARVFFSPALFPIFGTYDSYGKLEKIEEDDNTKTLEEIFGISIQQIANIICSGRKGDGYDDALNIIRENPVPEEDHFNKYQRITGDCAPFDGRYPDSPGGKLRIYRDGKMIDATKAEYDADTKLIHEHYKRYQDWCKTNPDPKDEKPKYKKQAEILIKMSGTWMRREIYDGLANTKMKDGYFDKIDLGVPAILESLGFKETGFIKDKNERWNRVFTQGPVSLQSDGNWIHVKDKQGIYDCDELKKYCSDKGLSINTDDLSSKGYWEQIYDYLIPVVDKLDFGTRWEGDRVRHLFLSDRYTPSKISQYYFDAVKKNGGNFLRKNMVDLHKVEHYWFVMGHYFTPIGTSSQDGEPEDVLAVINIAKKVLDEEIKERNKRNEE